MKYLDLLFTTILCALATNSLPAQTIAVTPDSDLRDVQASVRALTGNMTQDIIVSLADGTYYLGAPLEFGTNDGGAGSHRVIWRAENPGKASFSGGVQLGGWSLHDPEKNIWKAGVGSREFRQLYVNGRMATRARTPSVENNEYYGPYLENSLEVDLDNGTVRVPAAEVSDWAHLQRVELVLLPHWYHHRLRIASYTSNGRFATITPMEPERTSGFNKPARFYNFNNDTFYYFENAYEFLDHEGEWYLNTDADTLYYKPYADQSMTSATATVPGTAETLINVRGTQERPVRNLSLEGLQFEHTTWMRPSAVGITMTQCNQILGGFTETGGSGVPPGAVTVEYATEVLLEGNTFSKLGGSGLRLVAGIDNTLIRGNTFYDVASNGAVLGIELRPNPPVDRQISNVTVANNYFTRMGRDYSNATAILAGYVDNCVFEHNEIHDLNYSGMQIGQQPIRKEDSFTGARDNRIRFNDIYDVGQLYDDAGGIYTLSDQRGSTIFQNYVHDHRRGPWASTYLHAAVYLDNLSKGFTVSENVLLDNERDIVEQNGIGSDFNSFSDNGGSSQQTINRAGLQSAYAAIKDRVPAEATPAVVQPAATTDGLRIEVEEMELSGVELEQRSFYSGGSAAKPTSLRGAAGRASVLFTGPSGTYTLAAGFMKEDDGEAQHKLFVNGKLFDIWKAGRSAEGLEADDRVNTGVIINSGDVLTLTGIINQGAHGRMDYLQLYDRVRRVEAEDMTLLNATPEVQYLYANGRGVKPASPRGGVSFATTDGGTYDVAIGYLREDDGNAFHELFVDGELVDSWTAELSSSRRPGGRNPFERATELIKNVTIPAGAEVRVMSTIGGGSHGRLDWVELLDVSPVTGATKAISQPFGKPAASVTVFPNPAADADEVRFTIPLVAPGDIRIELYDAGGRLVRSLQSSLAAGSANQVALPSNSNHPLTAGLYTYVVTTDEYVAEGKLVVAK